MSWPGRAKRRRSPGTRGSPCPRRTGTSSSALEARTMIIDDRLLPNTGASGERDGGGSDTLGPGWDELAALVGEDETDHQVATPAADNSETNVDSPLGIYFRDIARIPL